MKTLLAVLCLWLLLPAPCLAWPGTVLSVHDGDTLTVKPREGKPVVVRLYGIDAPEAGQIHGDTSTDFLRNFVPVGVKIKVTPYYLDRYGRTVAIVTHKNRVLNGAMVRAGMAWVYPHYCKANFCARWTLWQEKARASGRGLWDDPDPIPPWELRKRYKAR